MDELLNSFASLYFFGILLMVGSFIAFLAVFFPSWYAERPRRFWLVRLTYGDDKEQQIFVRIMWLSAWILAIIGSLIVRYNDSRIPHEPLWITCQCFCDILICWMMAKLIVLISIVLQYVYFGFIKIYEWIFKGKDLFPKFKITKK